MWMSFMTSGVKILDDPRMYFLLSAGARDKAASPVVVRSTTPLPLPFVLASATARGFILPLARAGADFLLILLATFLAMTDPHLNPSNKTSKHQFLLARFEVVVVPQLLAGDDLLEMANALV